FHARFPAPARRCRAIVRAVANGRWPKRETRTCKSRPLRAIAAAADRHSFRRAIEPQSLAPEQSPRRPVRDFHSTDVWRARCFGGRLQSAATAAFAEER